MSPRLRSFAAWLGLAAVWLAALVPTVSHALADPAAGGGPGGWATVCTADGPAAPGPSLPAAPAHTLEHCPYCAQAPFGAALPPAPLAFAAMPAGAQPPAAPRGVAAWPSRWTAAAPRGPPAHG